MDGLKILGIVVLALLVTGLGVQTYRLDQVQDEYAAFKASAESASSRSAEKGASTGAEAVIRHEETKAADAPVVERVVERVRNVCVRDTAHRDLQVPAPTRSPDGPAPAAEDDRDRAFADDLSADIKTCSEQLSKLREFQWWVGQNSAESP